MRRTLPLFAPQTFRLFAKKRAPPKAPNLHEDLLSFGLNNKKHLMAQLNDDSLSLGEMLEKIRQMPIQKLFDLVQKSLLEAHGVSAGKLAPSQKRLFKEYSTLLTNNTSALDLT